MAQGRGRERIPRFFLSLIKFCPSKTVLWNDSRLREVTLGIRNQSFSKQIDILFEVFLERGSF